MTSYAQTERRALADALLDAGPDAPTLCEGWTSADLAAHLVIRENRPDAAVGIVVPFAARWTARVQDGYRDRRPYPELVDRIRTGPPAWSPARAARVDAAMNLVEYFVHHEDLLRGPDLARPEGAEPPPVRELDPELEAQLWQRLRSSAKLMFRRSPVGVTLVRTSHDKSAPRATAVAKSANPQMVTVAGTAGELVLFAFGRRTAAQVELTGQDSAVAQLRGAKLGL
ncbi:MAG TPA: TIGR03085 family metal-binding protein [Actinocrinis sp.]|nr:TIGR03085 family metal-binding protein [Actinocrinis sp.]